MSKSVFIKQAVNKVLPKGSRRRVAARRLLEYLRARQTSSLTYNQWIRKTESHLTAAVPTSGPLISIVVPAYNTPDRYLDPLLDSIIGQSYIHWELILVNGSPDKERSEAIGVAAQRDKRIRELVLTNNEGIAATTNVGIRKARGEYIAFMDHDDTLAPFALAEVVAALQDDPEIDLFYSDEDKISDDGSQRLLPFFKPAWSPELFLNVNYLAHFVVVRASLVSKINGIRLGYDGAQDYDFLLRILDHKPKVHAISRISYHWRQAMGSTGMDVSQKSYATDAGLRALSDYVTRNSIKAEVTNIEDRPTEYRLKYLVQGRPTVYLLATAGWDENNLKQLQAQTSQIKLEIITPLEALSARDGLLLHLHPGAVPQGSTWLSELVGLAQQAEIGWVGASVEDKAGRSTGIGYAHCNGQWRPLFTGATREGWGLMGPVLWPRNVIAVNPACAIIDFKKLNQAGEGTDPLQSALMLRKLGYRNVFWPFARLILDRYAMAPVPSVPVEIIDPYVNSNLEIINGDLVLKKR